MFYIGLLGLLGLFVMVKVFASGKGFEIPSRNYNEPRL